MKNPLTQLPLVILGFVSIAFLSSCDRRSDAEKAADEIEDAVEEVGKAAEEVAEDLGDAIKKAEKPE